MHNPNPTFVIRHKTCPSGWHDLKCSKNIGAWVMMTVESLDGFMTKNGMVFIFGDLINPERITSTESFHRIVPFLKGHFTAVEIQDDQFFVFSSSFSFLPIYYSEESGFISNKWSKASEFSKKMIDEAHLIEMHLFNYSLFNSTIFRDISCLQSFHFLAIQSEKLELRVHELEDLSGWFTDEINFKIDLPELSRKFIDESLHYLKEENQLITFTSGFDGRTILASALKAGKKVKTFSLGKLGNVDVSNPQTLSKDLGISFDGIDLGEEDYQKNYFHIAREMAQMSGGFNGFLYPHFYYGACQFPSNDILQTGYCGSELFRALHIEGAITSKEMVSIFTILDDDVLYKSLFSSSRLNFFKSNFLEKAKPAVQQHIKRIRSKRDSFKTQNHFFYWFIFTQVFPKVFGFWTSVQFEKKVIRTPFLDREFIQLLIKSPYAGCNNAFFTHQPIRRLKGQLLYAHILKDLKSPLFTQMTGKQYKPSQLLSWWGRLQIVWPYIRKRWSRKVAVKNIDNLGLISGVHRHAEKIRSMITGVDDIYSIDKVMNEIEQMHPAMSESERDVILQLISIAATLDKNENVFN